MLAGALGDVDVQYVWAVPRSHKIDLAARKSWCESNDPNFTAKAADVVGLYVAPAREGHCAMRGRELSGEGLATHSAELRLVDQTDVVGFPQHAFNLAVTIARC